MVEYKILIEDYPESRLADEAKYKLGSVLYVLGRYKSAIEAYKELEEEGPKNPFFFDAKFEIARCFEEQEKLGEAIARYKELYKAYPERRIIIQRIERVTERMNKRKR